MILANINEAYMRDANIFFKLVRRQTASGSADWTVSGTYSGRDLIDYVDDYCDDVNIFSENELEKDNLWASDRVIFLTDQEFGTAGESNLIGMCTHHQDYNQKIGLINAVKLDPTGYGGTNFITKDLPWIVGHELGHMFGKIGHYEDYSLMHHEYCDYVLFQFNDEMKNYYLTHKTDLPWRMEYHEDGGISVDNIHLVYFKAYYRSYCHVNKKSHYEYSLVNLNSEPVTFQLSFFVGRTVTGGNADFGHLTNEILYPGRSYPRYSINYFNEDDIHYIYPGYRMNNQWGPNYLYPKSITPTVSELLHTYTNEIYIDDGLETDAIKVDNFKIYGPSSTIRSNSVVILEYEVEYVGNGYEELDSYGGLFIAARFRPNQYEEYNIDWGHTRFHIARWDSGYYFREAAKVTYWGYLIFNQVGDYELYPGIHLDGGWHCWDWDYTITTI